VKTHRGFAFIGYVDESIAKTVLKMERHKVDDRELKLSVAKKQTSRIFVGGLDKNETKIETVEVAKTNVDNIINSVEKDVIFDKRVEDDVWSESLLIDYVKTQDDQILPYYGVRGDAKDIDPFQINHKYSKHGDNGKMNFLFHRFETPIFKVSVIVGDRQIYAQVKGIVNFVELGRESYACATFEVHTSSAIYNIKMTDGCKYIKNLLQRCGINQSYDLNVNNELKQKLIDVFPNKNSEPLQKRLLQKSSPMHAFLPIQEVAKINVDTIINPVEKTNMFLPMVKITSTHTDQLEISPTNNLVNNMKPVDLNELSSKTMPQLVEKMNLIESSNDEEKEKFTQESMPRLLEKLNQFHEAKYKVTGANEFTQESMPRLLEN